MVDKIARELTKEEGARAAVDIVISRACAGIVYEMESKERMEREAR